MSKLQITKNRLAKWFVTAMAVMSIAAMSCMTCFATGEESTVDMTQTLTTAFTQMKNDVFSYAGAVLPIALGIAGLFFVVKRTVKFFKSTSK